MLQIGFERQLVPASVVPCMVTLYYKSGVRKRCTYLDGHGSFACEVKYLTPIVYGRFTLTIVMIKRPYYTIAIK